MRVSIAGCEIMFAMTVSCPEDSTLQMFSPTFSTYILSILSPTIHLRLKKNGINVPFKIE